ERTRTARVCNGCRRKRNGRRRSWRAWQKDGASQTAQARTQQVSKTSALPRSFYRRSAEQVARDLLGAVLISTVGAKRTSGRIVEAEAYIGPDDDASHAAARIGRTSRNETMFGHAGLAYVYRIYGTHWCLNAVTGPVGFPAAVLIRALEPLTGLAVMRARREAPGGGRSRNAGGAR